MMNYRKIDNEIYSQDRELDDKPHGSIQWQGTDVCIDLYCECGFQGHFDGFFFFYFKCPQCGTKYAVGQSIKLIKLTKEQIKSSYVEDDQYPTCDMDND